MSKELMVYIHGLDGRMGQELQKSILESQKKFVLSPKNALDKADVILDFSSVEGNKDLLSKLKKTTRKSVVIGTTGMDLKTLDLWKNLAKKNDLNVLLAPNTSIGVLALKRCIALAAELLANDNFDISIVETHHRNKKDAPSGTAKLLSEAIPKNMKVDMLSVRGGGVFGEHEVRFLGNDEEITLSHRAFSRALFANGALRLAAWLKQQKPGFYQV